jgi:hypothetical protein
MAWLYDRFALFAFWLWKLWFKCLLNKRQQAQTKIRLNLNFLTPKIRICVSYFRADFPYDPVKHVEIFMGQSVFHSLHLLNTYIKIQYKPNFAQQNISKIDISYSRILNRIEN